MGRPPAGADKEAEERTRKRRGAVDSLLRASSSAFFGGSVVGRSAWGSGRGSGGGSGRGRRGRLLRPAVGGGSRPPRDDNQVQ